MNIALGEMPFKLTDVGLEVPGIPSPVTLRPGTSDEPTFIQVFVEKQYNFDFGNLRPQIIIDAGANVGFASIWFKHLFPDVHIFAIEPDPTNCAQFRKNLSSYNDVTLLQGALWSEGGTGQLVREIGGVALEHWAFQVVSEKSPTGTPTRLFTMNDIVKLTGGRAIDILKLDVEGAEDELFAANSQEWLPFVNTLIVEFHEAIKPQSTQRIVNQLLSSSWRVAENGEHFMFQREGNITARNPA